MSITFQSQWKNESGDWIAVPHLTTKNTSFLRTAALLKKMGISNYMFPLCLYDPDLKDVDVHDLEDDTPENEILRKKVMIEARRNVWYFLRECVRVNSPGGEAVRFRLDRGSCAMTWCFLNGIDYATMMPRQAQPDDVSIKTPCGSVMMGELNVGSIILAHDGTPTVVVGVYPLGLRDVYELTLSDGRSTRCCKDHLWKVYNPNWENPYDILSLEEILLSDDDLKIPVYNRDRPIHLSITSIKNIGKQFVRCIEVDHPDHLYITDNNIITHNTGKSICAATLLGWVMWIAGFKFQIGSMTKDNSLREENVKRVKDVGDNLPLWWLSKDKNTDKTNTSELYYHSLKTHFLTYVANADPRKADLQARGASPPVFWFDELEFIINIHISYPTILASTGTARENARMNGMPHSNIITTTAGDPTKPECKAAAKILEGAMSFTEHLYDMESYEKLHEVVEAGSPQKMIIGIFSHLQLGYTHKWLVDKVTRNKMTRDQVMRDYLNRRVSIQEKPIIPKHTLSLINSSQMDPKYIQILSNKFVIYWYLDKQTVESSQFRERPIVLGCDSSEMIGRDATTLVGVDPTDLSVVCTFRCNEGNINKVGVMIAQLLLMFPKMVWIPENKSSGTSLIDVVSLILKNEGHNPFSRIFSWIIQRRDEEEFKKYDVRDMSLLDTSARRFFGIKTDKSKRDELYSSVLLEGAEKSASRIRDRTLIQELSSLTERNGRVDHEVGGNDDTVIAWLLCMWFCINGRNLSHYGIPNRTVLSRINPGNPDKTQLNAERQEVIRNKLEDLESSLQYQRDPSLRKMLETEIAVLKAMVDNGPIKTPDTADELLRNPRQFVDTKISEQSRVPVKAEDLERNMMMLLGMR